MTLPSSRPRVLGIVGGTGPESTIDYYRTLISEWRRRRPDGSYPRVIIDSIEAGRVFRHLADGAFEAIGREVGSALGELAALTEPAYAGVPILGSARIHVDAAIEWLLGGP